MLATLRTVPDFPKPGITFMDVMPVVGNAELLHDVIVGMAAPWWDAGITHVAGIESRGFILGAPLAMLLGAAFIAVRKPGKLPWRAERQDYALEYGTGSLEVHVDACPRGARVLVVDDVLATGGTARAACALTERIGGVVVGCAFLIAIEELQGTVQLDGRSINVLLRQ